MNRLLPFLIVCAFATALFAQDDVSKAKSLIREGKCAEAAPALQKLSDSKSFRKHEGAQAAVLLTECYLREHKRADALKLASKFLEYHVASEYRERMELARAIVLTEQGSVYEGVEAMLRILAYTKNPAAKSHTKDVAIQTLAASLLNADQLQALMEKYPVDKDVVGWMQLQMGRECQNAKRYRAARYWYKKVLNGSVAENLSATAQQGLESLEGLGAGKPTILVLAPLSGDFAEFGAAAVRGVYLAHEQSGLGKKVRIRIADTRADASIALMRTQQAVNQDSIVAVIGPIMSAPAATVAAWLGSNFQNIPMLTPTATDEYGRAFWDMIRNQGDQFAVRNALSVGEDTEGGYTVPDEFERKLIQALEENNIFRQLATVIRTNSGTRKIPIANDTMEAQWIDEGEEIPETNTRFGQTTLSAYKLGTMIKISNELLHDSAFDLASYIAARFGVCMGNAEERAFFTGDGDKKPLGILADVGGAELGVTAEEEDIVTFDEIFDLYYSLKSPYRRSAQFVCNETLLLQLMKLKDKNDNYIWKPSLDVAKPDTILGRPIYTSCYVPGVEKGQKVVGGETIIGRIR